MGNPVRRFAPFALVCELAAAGTLLSAVSPGTNGPVQQAGEARGAATRSPAESAGPDTNGLGDGSTLTIPLVTRGPYLQMGTPSTLIVRWSTTVATDSRVRFGPSAGSQTEFADAPAIATLHEVVLSGLTPDTQYFYSVGTTTQVLAGGDADHHFRTAPLPGTRRPVRIWVIGDSGTANTSARQVRDAYASFAGNRYTDLWLMLGDNAYPLGTDLDYQSGVFDTYPRMLEQTVLWPTFGNHDGASASSGTQSGPYYTVFSLPTAGQAGGVPSGTEAYYSFDYANIHFICLNSYDVNRSPGSPMLTWLAQDLASTSRDWLVAFWHHPPYSKGSHDSDFDPRMTEMRGNVLPILEGWGVDLVLTGHSHSYERSYLLDGHYSLSGTLTEAMKKNGGDGRVDGSGAYQKPTPGPAPHEGAVYVVAGSSGQTGGGTLNHRAMYVSLNQLGSLVLDLDGDRMQAKFLDNTGLVRDYFTLVKNTGSPPEARFSASPVVGAAPLTVSFTDLSTTNAASWAWDFDENGTADSTIPSPSHVYSSPGVYTVRLDVANDSGVGSEIEPALVCVSLGVPPGVAGLSIEPDRTNIGWTPLPAASRYDLVKGDLAALASSGGDFASSLLACLDESVDAAHGSDRGVPPTGNGFYYLVRGVGQCGEAGSFDETGSGQITSRDPGIQASAHACP